MNTEHSMTLEEAIRVLDFPHGRTTKDNQKAFDAVQANMERLKNQSHTEEQRLIFAEELARLNQAWEIAQGQFSPKKSPLKRWLFSLFAIITALAVGAYFYLGNQNKGTNSEQLKEAATHLENRSWDQAEQSYQELLEVNPRSKKAMKGLQAVEEGREFDRELRLRFLLGRADALKEQGAWVPADNTISEALEMKPQDPQLLKLKNEIKEGRRLNEIKTLVEDIEQAKQEEAWQSLIEKTERLSKIEPQHPQLEGFQEDVQKAQHILAGYRIKADELYNQALALDQGQYSAEALELLEEAEKIAPSEKAAALYQKIYAYPQVIKVPSDAQNLAEWIAKARAGDQIEIGEGTFNESLHLPAGVIIEGVKGKTKIQYAGAEGHVIVIAGEGAPVILHGLTIQHIGISQNEERLSTVLIKGAKAILKDCEINYGSGHGIVVTEGGYAEITHCEVKGCGWDGIAIIGEGSEAVVRNTRSIGNLHHGLDAWDGGKVSIYESRFQGNGLTGVLLASSGLKSRIENSTIQGNREVGLVLSQGVNVEVSANMIEENLLGGIIVQGQNTTLSLTSNTVQENGEFGLAVTPAAILEKDEENVIKGNTDRQRWMQADLSKKMEETEKNENSFLRALPVEE